MLKIVRNMSRLDFLALMEVYRESNTENGAEWYPYEDPARQRLGAEQEFYAYLSDCFFRTEGAFYALWYDAGVCVSALRLEPYADGLLLEGLETAPDRRRQGHAGNLIRQVQEELVRGEPTKVYSHVSKKNTASLAAHRACGFRRILEHAVYADGSVLHSACTLVWETR